MLSPLYSRCAFSQKACRAKSISLLTGSAKHILTSPTMIHQIQGKIMSNSAYAAYLNFHSLHLPCEYPHHKYFSIHVWNNKIFFAEYSVNDPACPFLTDYIPDCAIC